MYGQSRTLPQLPSFHITLSTPQSRITTRSFLLYLLYYIFYVRKGRRFGEFARGTFGGEIKAPPPQALLILIRYLIYCILFHSYLILYLKPITGLISLKDKLFNPIKYLIGFCSTHRHISLL